MNRLSPKSMTDPLKQKILKEIILRAVAELAHQLISYGRQGDATLPVGAIEAAVADGTITVEEMSDYFSEELHKLL